MLYCEFVILLEAENKNLVKKNIQDLQNKILFFQKDIWDGG